MKTFINPVISSLVKRPRTLFAADASGALLSALLLWFVLRPFPEIFGIPASLLKGLLIPAIGLLFYGIFCFFQAGQKSAGCLLVLALANLLYCLVTVILLLKWQPPITAFGILYFFTEILLILILARIELAVASGLRKTQHPG